MTHWSTRSLADAAQRRGIVPSIAHSTVSLILRNADLQPHRSRYWKTSALDETFRQRAAKILWCYEMAEILAKRNEVVVCIDEKPGIQVLERTLPTKPMRPTLIERREFEYTRHGTLCFLVVFMVHTGKMRGFCLDRNNAASLAVVLPKLLAPFREKRRVHLIWDGGGSHIAFRIHALLQRRFPPVRTLPTPAHASWLNQAELLLRAFDARYLARGSWTSRIELATHLEASWREYNRLYAHPFDWSWTRLKMHEWVDRHDVDYVN